MKVVVDTNVIASSLISDRGAPWKIVSLLRDQKLEIVVSDELLREYSQTLNYEKLLRFHKLSSDEVRQYLSELKSVSHFVVVTERIGAISADPSDNKFIEAAVAGNADFIVSGDKHLLELGEYEGIQIVTPAIFVAYLDQAP